MSLMLQNDNQTKFWDFRNINKDAFERDIGATDWSLATENTNTHLGFQTFLQLFYMVLDKHVPFIYYTKTYNKTYKN